MSAHVSLHRRKFMLSAAMLAASAAVPSRAETYPVKPVRFVVPSAVGSGTDILARILGNRLGEVWQQQVVVDNRVGVGGVLGSDYVAKAPPDGYTLCMGFSGPISISPALLKSIPYNPLKDFAAVTLVDSSPNVLVVNPSLPAKSVKQLIELARARPGFLTFGSAGYGTMGHMCGETFEALSQTKMLHVPYKAVSQALTDVVGGEIKVLFHVAAAVMSLVKAGKLRALGVTSLKRWSILPDLPSIAEAGLPGYDVTVWHGVLVPAGTPHLLIDKLYRDMSDAMKTDEVRKQFATQWTEPLGTTPDSFASFLKADVERSASVVKGAGLHVE